MRFNIDRNINFKSWFSYGFLIKSSLFLNKPINNLFSNFSHKNFDLNTFSVLSDISYNIRRYFTLIRPLGSSYFFDLDLSVSNFNSAFYYYDLKKRSQFFWIANQNYFRSAEFLISSFEQPVFKDPFLIDLSFWVSYVSMNYYKFLKFKLIHNFSFSRDFNKFNKYLNILKYWIVNFYDYNFINYIFSFFYSLVFKRINSILLLLLKKKYVNKGNNIFKYFYFNSIYSSFIKLKKIFYYLLFLNFSFDSKYIFLNFNFIDSTFNFLNYKFFDLNVISNFKVTYLFNYLYKKNKIYNKLKFNLIDYYFSYKNLLKNRRLLLSKFLFFNSIIL